MESKTTAYMKKMKKENPANYQEYLEKQRERNKKRRDEKKRKWNEEPHTGAMIENSEKEKEAQRYKLTALKRVSSLTLTSEVDVMDFVLCPKRGPKWHKLSCINGQVMLVMDFAENRKASYASEVKSAHFGKGQWTLHPIVAFFMDAALGGYFEAACNHGYVR
ncbi:hypothetical protein ElyMa_006091800 [Elysia marginata]|uniref:Uncharacterized protein n=1 Tax=Elysia marginata TaxID=1093978 RepID=A0AAV4GRT4_9GAST|nr:hypothetical protein ElyMa_006091800 [Elysia marginata]